jgi:hypothetical protein
MKNIYNSNKKKAADNLLKKLVLPLSVQYAVACHDITITNYHFTWCSAVINMIFTTGFSSITCCIGKFYVKIFFFKLSFLIMWGKLYENYHYRTDFSFKLWIIKVFVTTR